MYFVNECTITAAPCSNGLQMIGDAVLSTIRGMLYFLPMSATSLMGKALKYGLGRVSAYMALVLSSNNFSKFFGSRGSAYLTSIPCRLSV